MWLKRKEHFKNFYTWLLCSLFKDIKKWNGLRTSIGWKDFGFLFISKRVMVDDTNALPSSYKSFCFNFLCSLTPNTSFCPLNTAANYNYSYSTKYIEINFNVHIEKLLEVNHDSNKKVSFESLSQKRFNVYNSILIIGHGSRMNSPNNQQMW